MSKNLLIPSCVAVIALTGAFAGFSAYQVSKDAKADAFYSEYSRSLQGGALNAITLAVRASSDNSFITQMQEAALEVDKSVTSLRRGDSTSGIAPVPTLGIASIDRFEDAWIDIAKAIDQISNSRSVNSVYERQANEARQVAESLKSDAAKAISRIDNSPHVDARVKTTLNKALESLEASLDLLIAAPATTTDNLSIAQDASKAFIGAVASIGNAMPRDKTLIDPLLQTYKDAQNLARLTHRAIESSSGAVDNAPHLKQIWAKRADIESSLKSLQSAVSNLPNTRMISPMILLGSVAAALVSVLLGVTLILRDTRITTGRAETLTSTVQSSQKERSRELHQLIDEMQQIGSGDLTVEFSEGYSSTNEIASTLNEVFPRFRNIVKEVQQTIVSLSAASEQTLTMARNTERSRNEQLKAIDHIGRLINELDRFTKQMDSVITGTRESSKTVSAQIATGSSSVSEVHDGVVKLAQSNLNIMHHSKAMTENIQALEHMVDVVRRVSNQASTVSLNAHLAADSIAEEDLSRRIRIGAEAMGRLTDEASTAAKQIQSNLEAINSAAKDTQIVLEDSQSEIKQLSGKSSNALAAMNAIHSQTTQLVERIENVSADTAMLNQRSSEVAETMVQIHHYASDYSSASEQTANAISNLNQHAQRVGETLNTFKV